MAREAMQLARSASGRGLLVAVALVIAAAAAADEPDPFFSEEGPDTFVGQQVPDPLEDANRPVFGFNDMVERGLIDPIARAYGYVVPDPVKRSVRGFFSNLNRPVVFVNELLQATPLRAGQTLGRFVLNSTLGIGGLLDPAAELGWTEHEADFGQTLGKMGVGPGFYVVLPFLGPSTARDTFGLVVDTAMRLDTWILPIASQLILGGSMGVTKAEEHRDELKELRRSSLDYYAAVRSAYLQDRARMVREARGRTACSTE